MLDTTFMQNTVKDQVLPMFYHAFTESKWTCREHALEETHMEPQYHWVAKEHGLHRPSGVASVTHLHPSERPSSESAESSFLVLNRDDLRVRIHVGPEIQRSWSFAPRMCMESAVSLPLF